MSDLPALWLPILATAIAVFLSSSVIHMVFKWHQSEYGQLPDETPVAAALRANPPAPGQYVVPHCTDMKQMQDPDMVRKFNEGPVALIVIRPNGPPAMGASLRNWFVLNLVVATIAALLAVQSFGLNAHPNAAGHLAGMTTLLAYGVGGVTQAIWMGRPWSAVGRDLLDALIYGTVTAFTFMALWPHGA